MSIEVTDALAKAVHQNYWRAIGNGDNVGADAMKAALTAAITATPPDAGEHWVKVENSVWNLMWRMFAYGKDNNSVSAQGLTQLIRPALAGEYVSLSNPATPPAQAAEAVTEAMVEAGLSAARHASDARLPRYSVVRQIIRAAIDRRAAIAAMQAGE